MKNKIMMSAAIALSLSSAQVLAQNDLSEAERIEAKCDAMAEQLEPIQSQLPMQIDYMTELTGMSTMKLSGSCMVNINYVFEEETFIQEMMEGAGGDLSEKQAIDFAQSAEGQEAIKDIYRNMAKQGFGEAKRLFPELRINLNVQPDGTELKTIMVTL